MKIANPLYDRAFKYLMENEQMACKVLSVILDKDVIFVSLQQQETAFIDEQSKLSLFILDFKATIQEKDGSKTNVLIELQKSKYEEDIVRFRNYLGSQYQSTAKKKQNTVADQTSNQITNPILPIITIYILGYKLEGNPYLAVKTDYSLIDATNHQKIEDIQDDFIKLLTHNCYVIQVPRLPEKRRTRLEKFFALFNQAWIAEKDYILDLDDVDEEFIEVAKHLSSPLQDDAFRRQLFAEGMISREKVSLEEKVKIAEEQLEKEKAKQKEQQAKEREKQERAEKEQAQANEIQTIKNLADKLNPEEIAAVTNNTLEEVLKILGK